MTLKLCTVGKARPVQPPEPGQAPKIQVKIQTFAADLADIQAFLSISFSTSRTRNVKNFLESALASLSVSFEFNLLDQIEKVDYLLLQSHIKRVLRHEDAATKKCNLAKELGLFGDWSSQCIDFVETRHDVGQQSGKEIATVFQNAKKGIDDLLSVIHSEERFEGGKERFVLFWSISRFEELTRALNTWWIEEPWKSLNSKLFTLTSVISKKVGIDGPSSADDIVGDPIGRKALLEELETEWIAYTPEELIRIGELELEWCEKEMNKASRALGFDSSQSALEHVKNKFVEPGEQIHVVRDLADEAITYVEKYDLITIPTVARDYWKTTMMTPDRQRVNPFFLGGERIIVSYPMSSMSHEDKLMSMRGNSPAFSRSTVFHELIPGHHLQFHFMDRHRPYRKLFETPFWIEGLAVYWELLLWQRGFPSEVGQKWATDEAENRIGMLFWRMHRCARIIFSMKFHLGQMTPRECIDLLVTRVGHEQATAEGEVRRSFACDYPPLYQAGYLLGAFQLRELRKELVSDPLGPNWKEKRFHDSVMLENNMPIELLRALLKSETLSVSQKASWKFKG